jgi:hypothetical protein
MELSANAKCAVGLTGLRIPCKSENNPEGVWTNFYQVNSLRYARHFEDPENAGGMNVWNEASDTWPKG